MQAQRWSTRSSRYGAKGSSGRGLRACALALWLAIFGGLYGAYVVWHYFFYGALLPNTATAKIGSPSLRAAPASLADVSSPGWLYVRAFVKTHGVLFLLPTALIGAAALLPGRRRVLVFFTITSLVFPVYSGDWMAHFRFMYAFPALVLILALVGVDRMLKGVTTWRRKRLWLSGLSIAGAASFFLGAAAFGIANMRMSYEAEKSGYQGYVTIQEVSDAYAPLRKIALSLGAEDPHYLLPDIGGTAYLDKMRIVDLAGLADYHVSHSGLNRKALEQYLFGEKRPELVSTHGHWRL